MEQQIEEFIRKSKQKSEREISKQKNERNYGKVWGWLSISMIFQFFTASSLAITLIRIMAFLGWGGIAYSKFNSSNKIIKNEEEHIKELIELRDILNSRIINNASKEKIISIEEELYKSLDITENFDKVFCVTILAVAIGMVATIANPIFGGVGILGMMGLNLCTIKNSNDQVKIKKLKNELDIIRFKEEIINKLNEREKNYSDKLFDKKDVNEKELEKDIKKKIGFIKEITDEELEILLKIEEEKQNNTINIDNNKVLKKIR